MSKKNKSVIITGATQRIGLALTQQSLRMGFMVIAHYHTTDSPLRRWLLRNPEYSGRVYFIRQDLTDDPATLIDASARFPVTLTGLINNASVFTPGNLRDLDHLRSILTVNTLAPLLLSLRFAALAAEGWIIHLTDAQTGNSTTFQNYRFSKKILGELTNQLALLLAPAIRVNAIAPGAILPASRSDRTYFNALRNTAPLRRTGTLRDVLLAYSYLVENTAITGQTLYVDNGLHLTHG
jgi:NAD(P)-dependent dehydrogenase (short-subunit alcohol dehydrogenase family)